MSGSPVFYRTLSKNAGHSDVRIRIMKRLFFTCMDVPLVKNRRFKEMNIIWNSISPKKAGIYLNALLGKRKFLNHAEYAELILNSKLFINSLSPMGLVSPRFFECMASGALVFCEESELYQNIFPDDIYVTFRSDLSDFDEKLFHFLTTESKRKKIIEKAHAVVKTEHTWEKRINDLLTAVEKLSTGRAVA